MVKLPLPSTVPPLIDLQAFVLQTWTSTPANGCQPWSVTELGLAGSITDGLIETVPIQVGITVSGEDRLVPAKSRTSNTVMEQEPTAPAQSTVRLPAVVKGVLTTSGNEKPPLGSLRSCSERARSQSFGVDGFAEHWATCKIELGPQPVPSVWIEA